VSSLRPPQYPCSVVVFTASGFIRGVFHLPPARHLRSFLNAGEEILKLTQAVLPGSPQVHAFLALQKSAVLLVVPQEDLEPQMAEPGPILKERRLVTCLLSFGSVQGYLETPEHMRTSDFLLRNPGFLELRECHIGPNPYLDPKEISGEAIPLVLVNAKCLVGLAEEDRGEIGAPEVD